MFEWDMIMNMIPQQGAILVESCLGSILDPDNLIVVKIRSTVRTYLIRTQLPAQSAFGLRIFKRLFFSLSNVFRLLALAFDLIIKRLGRCEGLPFDMGVLRCFFNTHFFVQRCCLG